MNANFNMRRISSLSLQQVLLAFAACSSLSFSPIAAHAQADLEDSPCGNPFRNHFGPYDYRTADRDTKKLVENAHFTPGVQSMTRPSTTTMGTLAADVAYTLHVFPNHHRALVVMGKLADRHQMEQPPGARYTLECYFQRAIIFRPNDTVARALYALFLGRKSRKSESEYQINEASRYAGEEPLSHYNLGLAALEIGLSDIAMREAKIAQKLGAPQQELENRLKATGVWKESTDAKD
jgi:hypothetical protein